MLLKRFNLLRSMLALFTLTPMMVALAQAQPTGPPSERRSKTGYRISYTPIYQFETDLDGRGTFDVQRHLFRFDVARFINRNWMVGIGLSFDYERWNFSDVKGLAGVDLWDEIFRPGISLPIFYSTGRWRLGLIPSLDFAGASDAETSESFSYGAVLSAGYAYRSNLVLGLGVGIFDRLDHTEVFPYVVVEWRINDHFRLTNPFRSGPVGPAGLEVVYSPNKTLEMGLGGAYRSYRFRLDDSSVVSDGIGEVDFWAPFLRVGWRLGKHFKLDLNGGALIDGSITIEDKNSNKLGETGYDTSPFVGITIRGRF